MADIFIDKKRRLVGKIHLEKNIYYQRWLRGYQSEWVPDDPNVSSTSIPSMPAAAMDINVQDAILPARATVKVHANLVQKSLETRRYIHVSRKTRKRPDPNSCKTT